MKIYMATMEYGNLAEAGGVKLVARSLCEELVREGHNVSVIIPRFGCTNLSTLESASSYGGAVFTINGKEEKVAFLHAPLRQTIPSSSDSMQYGGVNAILVYSPHFAEKGDIYTYTAEEEKKYPAHKKGCGHVDARLLDTILCKSAAYIIEKEVSLILNSSSLPSSIAAAVLCEDAACAALPAYLSGDIRKYVKCIVTIHNAAPSYHHEFSSLNEALRYTGLDTKVLCGAFNGNKVEPYLLAAEYATLTTVSEEYANELTSIENDNMTGGLSRAFSARSIQIKGILNGIDFIRYDAASNMSLLPYKFDPIKGDFTGKRKCREYLLEKYFTFALSSEKNKTDTPLFCFHGRMVRQKGIEVLYKALEIVFSGGKDILFAAMGQGEKELESLMQELCRKYSERVLYINGYDASLSRLVIASSDFIVLPSESEPCGQEDYIAQIYGTLPIAHATGGLQKIEDKETGFLYKPNTPEKLSEVICRIANIRQSEKERIEAMASTACMRVKTYHSWNNAVVKGYLPLFEG